MQYRMVGGANGGWARVDAGLAAAARELSFADRALKSRRTSAKRISRHSIEHFFDPPEPSIDCLPARHDEVDQDFDVPKPVAALPTRIRTEGIERAFEITDHGSYGTDVFGDRMHLDSECLVDDPLQTGY